MKKNKKQTDQRCKQSETSFPVLLLEDFQDLNCFLEFIGIDVKKSRITKINVDVEVLPCLLDKLFANFPATSCSDSISICDKDNNNNGRLTLYFITIVRN